jgi:hypothetical protein
MSAVALELNALSPKSEKLKDGRGGDAQRIDIGFLATVLDCDHVADMSCAQLCEAPARE